MRIFFIACIRLSNRQSITLIWHSEETLNCFFYLHLTGDEQWRYRVQSCMTSSIYQSLYDGGNIHCELLQADNYRGCKRKKTGLLGDGGWSSNKDWLGNNILRRRALNVRQTSRRHSRSPGAVLRNRKYLPVTEQCAWSQITPLSRTALLASQIGLYYIKPPCMLLWWTTLLDY